MNEFLLTSSHASRPANRGLNPFRLEDILNHPDVGLPILESIFEDGLKAAQKMAMCSKDIWRIIGSSVVSSSPHTQCVICPSLHELPLTRDTRKSGTLFPRGFTR